MSAMACSKAFVFVPQRSNVTPKLGVSFGVAEEKPWILLHSCYCLHLSLVKFLMNSISYLYVQQIHII